MGVQTVFMQLLCGCGCADCLHAIKLVGGWEGRAFKRLVQGGRLAEGCHAVNFAGMALKRAIMLWVRPCGRCYSWRPLQGKVGVGGGVGSRGLYNAICSPFVGVGLQRSFMQWVCRSAWVC